MSHFPLCFASVVIPPYQLNETAVELSRQQTRTDKHTHVLAMIQYIPRKTPKGKLRRLYAVAVSEAQLIPNILETQSVPKVLVVSQYGVSVVNNVYDYGSPQDILSQVSRRRPVDETRTPKGDHGRRHGRRRGGGVACRAQKRRGGAQGVSRERYRLVTGQMRAKDAPETQRRVLKSTMYHGISWNYFAADLREGHPAKF
mmetsp:Transcript_25273/g.39098  ORF Transcript_25273/g.39098 Transcript_25273/m.39098 type:complete len:200 (-) Transcript_25273:104-703(-)